MRSSGRKRVRTRRYLSQQDDDGSIDPRAAKPSVLLRRQAKMADRDKMQELFTEFDTDGNGQISVDEFTEMMIKLGLAPPKEPVSKSKIDESA